jgi:hypothetical protein
MLEAAEGTAGEEVVEADVVAIALEWRGGQMGEVMMGMAAAEVVVVEQGEVVRVAARMVVAAYLVWG